MIKNLKNLYYRMYILLHPNHYLENRANKEKFFEDEIRFLPVLCDKEKKSIDVGASKGRYSFHLLKYSSEVIAFEAFEQKYNELVYLFRRKNGFKIENFALSDKTQKFFLRIPIEDTGRSTLESSNKLQEIKGGIISKSVNCKKLDDFYLKNVGLIKIDVEGHEESVLIGSKETIHEERPNLIIEIEERHKKNSISKICDFLYEMGYKGFFTVTKSCIKYPALKRYVINHFMTRNTSTILYSFMNLKLTS